MKKLLSVLISVVMVFSAFAVSAVPAMAAVSPQHTTNQPTFSGQVNGNGSNDFTYTADLEGTGQVTITYTGQGTVKEFLFPGLTAGTDYTVVSKNGNTITIKLSQVLAQSSTPVIYNVILEETAAPSEDGDDEGDVEGDEDGDVEGEDESSTSPNTGAITAGLAVAGAGVAILAALKKSEDAE